MAVRLHMKPGVVAEHDRLEDSPDTLVIVEPSVGSVARSKGHLYLLVTSRISSRHALEATRLAAETIRNEYYYDESAGIRVCLQKAIATANKRLAHQADRLGLRTSDGNGPIGIGVAVVRGLLEADPDPGQFVVVVLVADRRRPAGSPPAHGATRSAKSRAGTGGLSNARRIPTLGSTRRACRANPRGGRARRRHRASCAVVRPSGPLVIGRTPRAGGPRGADGRGLAGPGWARSELWAAGGTFGGGWQVTGIIRGRLRDGRGPATRAPRRRPARPRTRSSSSARAEPELLGDDRRVGLDVEREPLEPDDPASAGRGRDPLSDDRLERRDRSRQS